jgi:predicted dehydrogenase
MPKPSLTFACIGLDHPHIVGIMDGMLAAGAQCLAFQSRDDAEPLADFQRRYPDVPRLGDKRQILEDPAVQMIVCASIPVEHAEDAISAMRHGKAVMVDKPGAVTFEQLKQIETVQAETGAYYTICINERVRSPSAVMAGKLIADGAIGRVIQTIGMAPHHHRPHRRRPWFYDKAQYGGILVDLACHQIDQFLWFTGSKTAEIVSSAVGNFANPETPGLEDFGELTLRSDQACGYARVDWLTPEGLGVWGDSRITILGTEGFIELRKNIDVLGRPGGNHLFVTDHDGSRHLDCENKPVPFFRQVIEDVHSGSWNAMPLAHSLEVCRLALQAQEAAPNITNTDKTRATP